MDNLSKSIASWQASRKLPVLLLEVLICGLLPPVGFYVLIGAAFSDSQLIGGGFQLGWVVLGISLIFGAPLLLGLSLSPDSRGARSGFFGIIWVFIVWVIGISQVEGLLERRFPGFNSFYVIVGLLIGGVVLIVSVDTGWVKNKSEYVGLALGLLVGASLSILIGRTISNLIWSGFGSFIISFPLVWLSAVFFPVLFDGRASWKSILMWILTMIVPIFIAIFGPPSIT